MHCRTTVAALEEDKHVMCEARMAMNAQEAHAMRDASREKPHLVAQIVPSPMTLGQDKGITRLIAEGFLGDVLVIEVRSGGLFIEPDASLHWRENFDLSGTQHNVDGNLVRSCHALGRRSNACDGNGKDLCQNA